jgi:hypothetical protein
MKMKNELVDYRLIEHVIAQARHQRSVALGGMLASGVRLAATFIGAGVSKACAVADRGLHALLMTKLGERPN